MTGKLGEAERILAKELEDVTNRLRDYDALMARRDRLQEALKALRAVSEVSAVQVRTAPPAATDFQRHLNRTFEFVERSRVPTPSGPSAAAVHVLRETKKALHIRELVAEIQRRGWFVDREFESLRATITGTLNPKAARGDEVEKTAPSTYRAIDEVPA